MPRIVRVCNESLFQNICDHSTTVQPNRKCHHVASLLDCSQIFNGDKITSSCDMYVVILLFNSKSRNKWDKWSRLSEDNMFSYYSTDTNTHVMASLLTTTLFFFFFSVSVTIFFLTRLLMPVESMTFGLTS